MEQWEDPQSAIGASINKSASNEMLQHCQIAGSPLEPLSTTQASKDSLWNHTERCGQGKKDKD